MDQKNYDKYYNLMSKIYIEVLRENLYNTYVKDEEELESEVSKLLRHNLPFKKSEAIFQDVSFNVFTSHINGIEVTIYSVYIVDYYIVLGFRVGNQKAFTSDLIEGIFMEVAN